MKVLKAVHDQLSCLQVSNIDLDFKVIRNDHDLDFKVIRSHQGNGYSSSDCVTIFIFRNIYYIFR